MVFEKACSQFLFFLISLSIFHGVLSTEIGSKDEVAAVGSNSVFVRGRMARISLPKEQNKFTIPPQGSPDLAAALLAWRTEHVKLIGASASGSLGGLAASDPPVNAVPVSEANG